MRSRIAAPAVTIAALLARADAALVPQLNFVSDADTVVTLSMEGGDLTRLGGAVG